MEFTSLEFLIFLPTVFAIYWLLNRRLILQNLFVILCSYFFYAWADWYYLLIVLGYTAVSYLSGLLLERTTSTSWRKVILWSAVAVNLSVLGLYKYFGFFISHFNRIFAAIGFPLDWPTLNLVLPIGISFFTFQALSYTIDVYRRDIPATHSPISFFAFLSFFPQILAGPIERAAVLLPQFQRTRTFSYGQGVEGMKRILWGLVKKMVIANNCSVIVNEIISYSDAYNGWCHMLAILLFTIQIYSDFSGYSDIAVGCGKLLGINLSENFRFPYFSHNIREFWTRWHITLYTWLRDYVYFPLGGSRRGFRRTLINILIVFALSGLWHGAALTKIGWGIYSGICIVVAIFLERISIGWDSYTKENRKAYRMQPRHTGLHLLGSVLLTFFLVMAGYIIFMNPSLSTTAEFIGNIFSTRPNLYELPSQTVPTLCYVAVFMLIEYLFRNRRYVLDFTPAANEGAPAIALHNWQKWLICWALALSVFLLAGPGNTFIYFRF